MWELSFINFEDWMSTSAMLSDLIQMSLMAQVSHTLLQLIDKETGQQLTSPHERMAIFVSNLRSALPHAFGWLPSITSRVPVSLFKTSTGRGVLHFSFSFTIMCLMFTCVFEINYQ